MEVDISTSIELQVCLYRQKPKHVLRKHVCDLNTEELSHISDSI